MPVCSGALNCSLLVPFCFRGTRFTTRQELSAGRPTSSHQFSSFRPGYLLTDRQLVESCMHLWTIQAGHQVTYALHAKQGRSHQHCSSKAFIWVIFVYMPALQSHLRRIARASNRAQDRLLAAEWPTVHTAIRLTLVHGQGLAPAPLAGCAPS